MLVTWTAGSERTLEFNLGWLGRGQSQCPRGLMCGSATTCLWELRVRIPPGGRGVWVHVSCVSVVSCQVEVSVMGRSFSRRSPTKCGASGFDCGTWKVRRPRATRAVEPWEEKKMDSCNIQVKAKGLWPLVLEVQIHIDTLWAVFDPARLDSRL